MKKAVTPIISIVLVLMMMIAIAGGTYYWITEMQGGIQEQAGRETESTSSTDVPFSLLSVVCEEATDVFSWILVNQGPQEILGDQLFIMTISDINGLTLGTNTTLVKSSTSNIADGGVISMQGMIDGLDIQRNTEYIVQITGGSSVQTKVCNSQ